MASEDASLPPTFHRAKHWKMPTLQTCLLSLVSAQSIEERRKSGGGTSSQEGVCFVGSMVSGCPVAGRPREQQKRGRNWSTERESSRRKVLGDFAGILGEPLLSGTGSALLLSEPQLLFAPSALLCFPLGCSITSTYHRI